MKRDENSCKNLWRQDFSTGALSDCLTLTFSNYDEKAVMGGLVTALGCLFTSFASQFHQLFFSYGTIIGRLPTIRAGHLVFAVLQCWSKSLRVHSRY